MNPLRPIAFLLITAAIPFVTHAELVQLLLKGDQASGVVEYSETITLAEGDYAELISFNQDTSYAGLEIVFKETVIVQRLDAQISSDTPALAKHAFIGPATLRLTNKRSSGDPRIYAHKFIALFRVARGGTPAGSIMVPEDDPTATFEVFMEASTDMETWVRVIPGDYDASGGAKFFRVRMVKK